MLTSKKIKAMIEVLKDLPPYIAAFKTTGKVTKEDYEKVVIPFIDRVAKKYGKINFLLCLETDVSNYTAGAWMDDAFIGIKHFTHWNKIAIVSQQDSVKKITDLLGNFIPGETKGFKTDDLAAAIYWVSQR
jgi:SpoIIAA-like